MRPFDPAQVPFGEGFRFRFDDKVFLESWIGSTDLRVVTRDDEARLRVQEERLRIASELHDIVGHGL